MASFEDLFAGYGMSPGLGGGEYPGFGGMRNSLTGLGLGMMSAPGGQGWANAMKGYEQGAAIDSRSMDRRAALAQQAQERMFQRQMQAARMGQQQQQWEADYGLRQQGANREQTKYLPAGEDDDGNPMYREVIFSPSTGESRMGRIIKGGAGEEAPAPAPAPAPSGGGLVDQLGANQIGTPGQQPQVRQQFLDEAPTSANVEDRTRGQAAAPEQPQGLNLADLKAKLQAQGFKGKQLREALSAAAKHYATNQADLASGKMTEQQMKANNYATRMDLTDKQMGQNDIQGLSPWNRLTEKYGGDFQAYAQPEAFQSYKAAKDGWLDAFLRQDSGAQINQDEWTRYERDMFPQPGQSQKVVEQKRELRAAVTKVMKRLAGQGYVAPDVIVSEAQKLLSGDGGGQDRVPFVDTAEAAPAAAPPEQAPASAPSQQDTSRLAKLGPVTNIAEAGARGIDWATQQVGRLLPEGYKPTPRQPVPYSNEVDLGQTARSVGGMAKDIGTGLVETAKDVGLPWQHPLFGGTDTGIAGKVASGEVGPLEGAGRALNVATMAIPGARMTKAAAAAEGAPIAEAKIEQAATKSYNAVTDAARGIKAPNNIADIAEDMVLKVDKVGPSVREAPKTYEVLDSIKEAKTARELVVARKELGKIIRTEGGEEAKAAGIAKGMINKEIDRLVNPVTRLSQSRAPSELLEAADKNYAISKSVQKKMERAAAMEKDADAGGPRVGTRLRQFGREVNRNPAPYISAEERAAAEKLSGGNRMKQAVAGFDPSRGGLPLWLQVGMGAAGGHVPAAGTMAAGYISGKVYDNAQRRAFLNLMARQRAQAPAAIEAGGFRFAEPAQYQKQLPYGFTPLVPRYSSGD
jgi:hypothetical protein